MQTHTKSKPKTSKNLKESNLAEYSQQTHDDQRNNTKSHPKNNCHMGIMIERSFVRRQPHVP